jgi:hypothetical protein
MRRTLVVLVVVMAGLLAPTAHAASTIGQVFTPTAQTTATVAQTGISTGVGYTVPRNGVITSWSFQADTDGSTVRLKAARAALRARLSPLPCATQGCGDLRD